VPGKPPGIGRGAFHGYHGKEMLEALQRMLAKILEIL
jgi:hypothetical protein